jgi:hypothetical protein
MMRYVVGEGDGGAAPFSLSLNEDAGNGAFLKTQKHKNIK